jgi:hypothetical protein
MSYFRLPVALSENHHDLVWACNASIYGVYFCIQCGEPLQLDVRHDNFIHIPPVNCSLVPSHKKFGLLCLEQALRSLNARIQLTRKCERCGESHLQDISGRYHRLIAPDGTDVLLIEGCTPLLVLMRPASSTAKRWAARYEADWVEIDARNVMSATPLAVLDSNPVCMSCGRCDRGDYKKELGNPYDRIGTPA